SDIVRSRVCKHPTIRRLCWWRCRSGFPAEPAAQPLAQDRVFAGKNGASACKSTVASVAQLVEQQTLNLFVHGSSPCRGTTFNSPLASGRLDFPRGRMKKYLHVINIGLQSNLAYRFNYLTRTLFSFIPLFAMLSLWRVIYENQHGAGTSNFSQAEMMFYYLLVAAVDVLTAVNEDDWQIAADIREGNISQFLLKPVDYLWYRLCLFFSGRIAFVAMAS